MINVILLVLIGITLLLIEAAILIYKEVKFLRALIAGIEQNLNHIWEHIHKIELK